MTYGEIAKQAYEEWRNHGEANANALPPWDQLSQASRMCFVHVAVEATGIALQGQDIHPRLVSRVFEIDGVRVEETYAEPKD
jgi:hypothetical protein